MKNLHQFQRFALNDFLDGKTLVVVDIRDWVEYGSDSVLGKRVEVVITQDNTAYVQRKDGTVPTNLYDRITVKMRHPHTSNAAVGDEVRIINGTATVWGERSDRLSVTAEGLEVVKPATKPIGKA